MARIPMRRLPLNGAQNVRDLGGYPCAGGATKWGVFLRGDQPCALTLKDFDFLTDYGVCNSLDLRSGMEREQRPSALEAQGDFTPFHVSLNDKMNAERFEGDLPGSMAGLYISLLDEAQEGVAQVMNILAGTKGGTLYHCAAGKDRTGVISMLLLKLAGVADADVVADYAITEVYMREIFDAQSKLLGDIQIPEFVFRSVPGSMWRTLQHLKERYGTAEEYLLGIGLKPSALQALRAKFVEEEF